jgi:hypothetical protein
MGNNQLDASFVRVFDVEDVQNGNAVIEHKIKRLQFNLQSMMGNESFDSENEADMKGPSGKALEKTIKNKYTMTLDPAGKVLDVKKDEDSIKSEPAPEAIVINMISKMAEGLEAPMPGDKSDFSILPSKEIGVGESWIDSVENRKTVYTIDSITNDLVVISFTESQKIEQKQEMMGQEVSISSNEFTTGTIRLDRSSGILRDKTAETNSEGTMNAMGQSIPMQSTVIRKWEVK